MRQARDWRRHLPVLAVSLLVAWFMAGTVRAGSITGMRDYLKIQRVNVLSGEVHQIFFTPATSLVGAGNTLVLEFPANQSAHWCRTAGADLVVTGITNPEGATENATPLPGVLIGSCNQGNGSSQGDQIIVSGIDPITSGTHYGVSIADGGVATLGTSTASGSVFVVMSTTDGVSTTDVSSFAVTVVNNDRVNIAATVDEPVGPPANPVVHFQGRSSTGTSVQFYRNGVAIGADATDANAIFDLTLANQPTGQHQFLLVSQDADGRSHPGLTFALNLALGSTTVVNNIFFGPTIQVQPNQIQQGGQFTVSGRTVPESVVSIYLDGTVATTVTADTLGAWSVPVSTQNISVGTHDLAVQAKAPDTATSELSQNVSVSVTAAPVPPVNRPVPPTIFRTSDLNQDGRVDLIDFSILLFYWNQLNPSNRDVDINHDGRVNIVDLSIMFYQWNV